MIITFTLIFFILGLIIGSFLNVVICRFNSSRSLGGRSACMSCCSTLSWYELIPLFSYMGLMGRCKNCKTKISIQYPIVEFVTGVIFAMLFLKFSAIGGGDMLSWLTPTFAIIYAYYATMFSLLVVIVAYDMKHKIIPDMLSVVFGILAFIGIFFLSSNSFLGSPVLLWHTPSLVELFSGVLLALPFASLWLVSRGTWIGLGDAKLALGLGWFLGLSMGFSAIVIAFWSGALVGISLILFKKGYGMKSEIPFALYLVFGTLFVFFLQINLFPL